MKWKNIMKIFTFFILLSRLVNIGIFFKKASSKFEFLRCVINEKHSIRILCFINKFRGVFCFVCVCFSFYLCKLYWKIFIQSEPFRFMKLFLTQTIYLVGCGLFYIRYDYSVKLIICNEKRGSSLSLQKVLISEYHL